MADEETPVLTLGAILGDSDSSSRSWAESVMQLNREVEELAAGISYSLRVNVVFHVHGRLVPNEFEGVRTGSLLRKKTVLIMQAAVSDPSTEDHRAVLLKLFDDAVAEAERHVIKRKIADGLPVIREIVSRIPGR